MTNKKGFLFIVTTFLILTYILLSISVWVKSIETSERLFSEFYRESTVELSLQQITPERVDNISNIIMRRALLRLNDHAAQSPVRRGPETNENFYVNRSLYQLFTNGSADGTNFIDASSIDQENSSLSAWISNLNASLLGIGVSVNDFRIENFSVNQTSFDRLNYSLNIMLRLSDSGSTISVSRIYQIRSAISIAGMVDPALLRSSRSGSRIPIYRQFFFSSDYDSPASLAVHPSLSTSRGGQGWFYGPLAAAGSDPILRPASSIQLAEKRTYVLVGSFDQIINFPQYQDFGAYIVTDPPRTTIGCGGNLVEANTFNPLSYRSGSGSSCTPMRSCGTEGACTGKPFIVVPGFNPSDSAFICPSSTGSGRERCALIISNSTSREVEEAPARKIAGLSSPDIGIFGIEPVRDFVMCGYYTRNLLAPSYLQRLMNDSYSLRGGLLGIETFVIGEYARPATFAGHSRLDRELFRSDIRTIRIRGLPGCRTSEACSSSEAASMIGIFAVSNDVLNTYSSSLGIIDCASSAGCG